MKTTVDPILMNDPSLATGVKRAIKLLEPIATTDPEAVSSHWRSIPDDPAGVELELFWEEQTDKATVAGRLRLDDLLKETDNWVQGLLRSIWNKLMSRRNKLLLKRVREILQEVERSGHGQD